MTFIETLQAGKAKKRIKNYKHKMNPFEQRIANLYANIKNRAKTKGLEFSLKKSDIVIPPKCPILGIPLNFSIQGHGGAENTPSVDRIDNSKGYTPDNIQVISMKANTMKNSASKEELLKFAFWVYRTFL